MADSIADSHCCSLVTFQIGFGFHGRITGAHISGTSSVIAAVINPAIRRLYHTVQLQIAPLSLVHAPMRGAIEASSNDRQPANFRASLEDC